MYSFLSYEVIVGDPTIIFSVEKEKFFFVGHKSGYSNLAQILTSQEEKVPKTTNDVNEFNQNSKNSNISIEKEKTPVSSNIETKKYLKKLNYIKFGTFSFMEVRLLLEFS